MAARAASGKIRRHNGAGAIEQCGAERRTEARTPVRAATPIATDKMTKANLPREERISRVAMREAVRRERLGMRGLLAEGCGHGVELIGYDAAIAQHDVAVGIAGQHIVMRNQNERSAGGTVEVQQDAQHGFTVDGVKVTGRLVSKRIGGRSTKARASATRCCSPPESWTG